MKKSLIILFSLLFFYHAIAQDSASVINEFSARLKKNNIYLKWVIKNFPEISKIKLEVKNGEEAVYQLLDEINGDNFSKKIKQDSAILLQFNYIFKPNKNGVYFFKINILDKNFQTKNTDAIKIGVSDIVEFKLHQNTPNPFNPTTYISYELYSAAKVTLRIYSLDGKEIETLIDDFQNAGTYKIEFNATKFSELSSGIYFYKLQTGHSSDIKKMIFTK